MIDIGVMYLFLLVFFSIVGYLRGWQREVIAMAGLVASIAALNQFAFVGAQALGAVSVPGGPTPEVARQTQFWMQAIFHSIIAFFSYQMVGRIADLLSRGRFAERLRTGLETRITGTLFGVLNGYLYVGALWGFLEYMLIAGSGYQRLDPATPYPWPSLIIRPTPDSFAYALAGWLPQNFEPTSWLIAFFIVFFVVIIALV